jgi:outer membrane biogenesis lipoprotein LolB
VLGYSLLERNVRVAEGMQLVEKAYRLAPNDAAIIDSVGWGHYRLGDLQKSLGFLRQAFAANPDPEIASHLGEVLWMHGDKDEAKNIWSESLRQHPQSEPLQAEVYTLMRNLISALLLLGLVGCATPKVAPSRPIEAAHASFTLDGRVAVKHEGGRSSAGMHWVHSAGGDDILLLGPLGVTVAHLMRDAQGVHLDASSRHYDAQDSGELTQHVLGWHLPLSGLQYWVLALPVPGRSAFCSRMAGRSAMHNTRQPRPTVCPGALPCAAKIWKCCC